MTSHDKFYLLSLRYQLHSFQSLLLVLINVFQVLNIMLYPEKTYLMLTFQTAPVNHRQFDYQKS